MNRYKKQDQYSNWFNNKIISYTEHHLDEHGSKPSVHFITISFNHIRLRKFLYAKDEIHSLGKSELDIFKHIYNFTCRKLVGRNYHKMTEPRDLPFVIAGVDVNGTKYAKSLSAELTNAHLHTIWSIPKHHITEFYNFFTPELIAKKFEAMGIRDIDFKKENELSNNRGERLKTCSYVAKSIAMNSNKIRIQEDLRFFPRPE